MSQTHAARRRRHLARPGECLACTQYIHIIGERCPLCGGPTGDERERIISDTVAAVTQDMRELGRTS